MEPIDALLGEVVTTVGEELAMLLPAMPPDMGAEPGEGAEAPEPPHIADGIRMCVGFQGPWFGELLMTCGGQVPQALAANMLGAEENPDPELVRDACAEFANVICGNLLPRLAGTGPVFTLGAPVVTAVAAPSDGYAVVGTARIEFDEGPVEVMVSLDEVGQNEVGRAGIPPP